MHHLVFEESIAQRWQGGRWVPIRMVLLEMLLEHGDEAYLWPDRATAEAAKFVPPVPVAAGWIAVADRVPAGPGWYLVTGKGHIACRGWNVQRFQWVDWENCEYPGLELATITHWQPCPDLPGEVPR